MSRQMWLKIMFDGKTYELALPLSPTFREARMIKLHTGLRLGDIEDALAAGDADGIKAAAVLLFFREDPATFADKLLRLEDELVEESFDFKIVDPDKPAGGDDDGPPDEPAAPAAAGEPDDPSPQPSSSSSTTETPEEPGSPS